MAIVVLKQKNSEIFYLADSLKNIWDQKILENMQQMNMFNRQKVYKALDLYMYILFLIELYWEYLSIPTQEVLPAEKTAKSYYS